MKQGVSKPLQTIVRTQLLYLRDILYQLNYCGTSEMLCILTCSIHQQRL